MCLLSYNFWMTAKRRSPRQFATGKPPKCSSNCVSCCYARAHARAAPVTILKALYTHSSGKWTRSLCMCVSAKFSTVNTHVWHERRKEKDCVVKFNARYELRVIEWFILFSPLFRKIFLTEACSLVSVDGIINELTIQAFVYVRTSEIW